MDKSVLVSASPLDGYSKVWTGLSIKEGARDDLCSVTVRKGERAAVEAALASGYGVSLPAPGRASAGTDKPLCMLWTGQDQYLAMRVQSAESLTSELKALCATSASCVEQSDSWVGLIMAGPQCLAVLERLCPLDLSDAAFPVHATTRTVLEHIPVVMMRREDDEGACCFELMTLTSFADSFIHELETAAISVCGPAQHAKES